MTGKHWRHLLDVARNSAIVFKSIIVLELIEVFLLKLQTRSPRTVARWMEQLETDDITVLAERIIILIHDQHLLDEGSGAQKDEEQTDGGTDDV